MVVRRIGVLSLGRILGLIYGAFGFLAGAIFSVIAVAGSTFGVLSGKEGAPLFGLVFGVGAVILLPVLYGVLGFVGGVLTGAIYNLVARAVGGIEVELQ
jgi:hypothetical protein